MRGETRRVKLAHRAMSPFEYVGVAVAGDRQGLRHNTSQ